MITANAIITYAKHSTLIYSDINCTFYEQSVSVQSHICLWGFIRTFVNVGKYKCEFNSAVILIQYDIILLFKNHIIWMTLQLRPSPTYLHLHWPAIFNTWAISSISYIPTETLTVVWTWSVGTVCVNITCIGWFLGTFIDV